MNTFGPTGSTNPVSSSLGQAGQQFPLYDPRAVRSNRQRFRRDMLPLLERANSFYCPSGRWPSRGWILLARSDYNKIGKYSTKLELNIDTLQPLKNLCIVQAQCVTRGLASDKDALYLVEITDARGILHNEWFQFPTASFYNIRSPAYPQTFYPNSMNSSVLAAGQPPPPTTTWTWTTMLRDLWNQMASLLGAWPSLPSVPSGTPEGFWLPGVPAWSALNDILDYLGMGITCDLTLTNPYTIVTLGATDTTFTTLQTKYKTNLEDDLEWIDTGAGRVPKTIKVLFRRRNSVYGTEETVTYRKDIMAQQWSMAPYYTVTLDGPVANAVGTHLMWSDFTVRYDDSSNPLDEDITMATAIAKERVAQYFGKVYRQTAGFMTQTYAGALPFTTGSQVDGVAWLHDHSWRGWQTQVVRGPCPPWPEIYGRHDGRVY